jgi:hypothetical protein
MYRLTELQSRAMGAYASPAMNNEKLCPVQNQRRQILEVVRGPPSLESAVRAALATVLDRRSSCNHCTMPSAAFSSFYAVIDQPASLPFVIAFATACDSSTSFACLRDRGQRVESKHPTHYAESWTRHVGGLLGWQNRCRRHR